MSCRSICLLPECFDTVEKQKERYENHHNSLNDSGYRSFLESFIKPVLEELKEKDLLQILDYGSGPEPALCQLMKEFVSEGIILKEGCQIRGWDPFFAPETPFYDEGADLVTCLEVAEHFEKPIEDMKKLADAVKGGGYAAIGTMLLPLTGSTPDDESREVFKNWWYRSDSTHVAFYTIEGLKRCAASAGLEFVKALTDRAFLFRKKV